MTVNGLNNVKEKILPTSELKSCVKLEVAVLGSPVSDRSYGLCGPEILQQCSASVWT